MFSEIMNSEETSSFQENNLCSSRKYSTKKEFSDDYSKFYNDEIKSKQLYFQILSELKKATLKSDTESFKYFYDLLGYMNDLKNDLELTSYSVDETNPLKNTNVVILACKHNNVGILKYIFNNHTIIFNHSIFDENINPRGEDETSHNAFYYAVRSGNIELLETLIDKWPNDYFVIHVEEIDEILSKVYEELKIKNVLLSYAVEIFVESKLINLRFFTNTLNKVKKESISISNVKERIDLLLENICTLNSVLEVNDRFLFLVRCITQNINILKRQLKSTYDRLPWEEIEFCLISFVSCYMQHLEINIFYQATLNRDKILKYLNNFSKRLELVKDILTSLDVTKLNILPNISRKRNVAQIIKANSQFEELYNDHQQIRDIHSLKKIDSYIKLAISVDVTQKEGQLIIIRSLQVIGEFIKNTLESPNLSEFTSELLLLQLPLDTRRVLIDLRNSLSHVNSLSRRIEVEENADLDFFNGVKNDTKKIGNVINDIFYQSRIKIIRHLLQRIIGCENLDEVKNIALILRNFEIYKMESGSFKYLEHEKLEKLVKELRNNIPEQTNDEQAILKEMEKIITSDISKEETVDNYYIGVTRLKHLKIALNNLSSDDNTIRIIKHLAKKTLMNMTSKVDSQASKDFQPEQKLGNIIELSIKLCPSKKSIIRNERHAKSARIIYEIVCIADYGMNNIQWVNELREKLIEKSYTVKNKQNMIRFSSKEEYSKQLTSKLSTLKNILNCNSLSNQLGSCSSWKNDKPLQAKLEMLTLDILSILGISKNYLENNNRSFLDVGTPLLIGKCLRNHLAHDNTLMHILLSDPSVALILNAQKLTSENIIMTNKKIGKRREESISNVKSRYKQGLDSLTNQEIMFTSIEAGNLEHLKNCIAKGADIHGRNINMWTTLHFAAKADNIEVVRFLLNHNVNMKLKDINEQSPLHIAAAYGNCNIVKLFIRGKYLNPNDVDNYGNTPLHRAAQSGHRNAVQVLLKYKADTKIKDAVGSSALISAVHFGYTDIVQILLEKEVNVDINQMIGGFTPLHISAEKGHLDLVNLLLDRGANVHEETDYQVIPLHLAALHGYVQIVNILLLKGSDANSRTVDGCTPLHYAVENGHKEVVEVLLNHGGEPNVFDKVYKNTPLHYAAEDGHEHIVRILLEHKADVNSATFTGITPLHNAIHSGHIEIIDILLQYNVNIRAKNNALHVAVLSGKEEVVKHLLHKNVNINGKDNNDTTVMHLAALTGKENIVKLLIENKFEINVQDASGCTPLHCGSRNGHAHILDLLLKNKAEVNAKSNDGFTSLHLAAQNGSTDAVKLLLKYNADLNIMDNFDFNPLHVAARYGRKNAIKLLLKNKADIDARGSENVTALHLAIEAGLKDVVEFLIANKADTSVKDKKNNLAPLCLAVRGNKKEIVAALINGGGDINADGGLPLLLAVKLSYKDIVKLLLEHKADINVKENGNIPLLHIAAEKGNVGIIEALLIKGVDINGKSRCHQTAVHFAANRGHHEIVKILLVNGAARSSQDSDGLTPLHRAAAEGHYDVVKCLLDNDANVYIKDKENRTALEFAVCNGHLEVVKLLLQQMKLDINYPVDDSKFTLLHIGAQGGHLEIIRFLVHNGSDIDAKNVSGSKPIHIAAREGYKEIVEFFCNNGMTVDALGTSNQTPLHYAAYEGKLNVAEYLIQQGADVNIKDCNGITPLHIAAIQGNTNFIEVILANGAFINILDILNRKPVTLTSDKAVSNLLTTTENLFQFVKKNSLLEIEGCIRAGAIVGAKTTDNVTPLHYAAWKGYEGIVNILLLNDCNPNAIGKKGLTPLHFAAKYSHLNVLKALLANGAIYNIISESGKIPLDFAEDNNVIYLLRLINNSFEKVENNNYTVIRDLRKIIDIDVVRAVMGALNVGKKSLITTAIHSNFSALDQLKGILQDDLANDIEKAEKLSLKEKYEEAIKIFQKILEKRREILGLNNPGTLDIEYHIALTWYTQQKYEKALNSLERIYQLQKEMLGENNAHTLKTRSSIALILHRQGKNEEALIIYKHIYQQQKGILNEYDPDLMSTQIHMALVLNALYDYDESLNINYNVLKKREKLSGRDHPTTMVILNNIAMVLNNQGKYDDALKIYREVYEMRKRDLGPHHSDTLRVLHNTAVALSGQNKHGEALKTYEEVLKTQKSVLGSNHVDTLNTQAKLAALLVSQGKCVSATKIFNECLPRKKVILGPNHPDVKNAEIIIDTVSHALKLEGKLDVINILKHRNDDAKTAISNGDVKTLEYLLNNKIDVNEKDEVGTTLLHFAVNHGHIDIVKSLLNHGADVLRVTNKGNTPLHSAVAKSFKEIVQILLDNINRDKLHDLINAKTTGGGTASLHVAAKNGCLEIVNILLKNGATYNIKNKEGKTPLDVSVDPNIINLFRLTDQIFKDVTMRDTKIINVLETLMTDDFVAIANTHNSDGKSLIQLAIINKCPGLARRILSMLKKSD